MCPDPEDPDDVTRSKYEEAPHHVMLIQAIEKVYLRLLMRFANSIPPQHGKSTILSKFAVAWMIGKNPTLHIIVGTYSGTFAQSIGAEVREIIQSDRFKRVFPECKLRRDSTSKSEMKTTQGGSLTFVGRGEATTGRPCDVFIIDDPLKDNKEAESQAIRKELHDWYASVVFSRCHVLTTIIIVHTRWHEDDLIGRLCDPTHPDHDPQKARRWTYINIPAIVDDPDLAEALGLNVGDALWSKRFPLHHLQEANDNNPRIFSALYMGRPTPEEGDYFKRDNLLGYTRMELKAAQARGLRMYAASDHALTEKQRNDDNVLGAFGVDPDGVVWIMPDLVFAKMESDRLVDEMISLMKRHKPQLWFAEDEHIRKAIGPFLRKRQRDERAYTTVVPMPSSTKLETRARSIQGMTNLHMVRFPTFMPWWERALNQMIKFPNATHDDFVSFLALIGMALDMEGVAREKKKQPDGPKTGTLAWVKQSATMLARREKRRKAVGGF